MFNDHNTTEVQALMGSDQIKQQLLLPAAPAIAPPSGDVPGGIDNSGDGGSKFPPPPPSSPYTGNDDNIGADETEEQQPEPMFKQESSSGSGPAKEEEPIRIRKWSNQETAENMEVFLNCRNLLQAELLAAIAGETDKTRFEMDEEQLNRLARVYAPYFKLYGGKIPDWVWIIAAEAVITGGLIKETVAIRKINRRNKIAVKSGAVAAAVVKNATATETRERTRFDLFPDGFYKYNRYGEYLSEARRGEREKADVQDLQKIMQCGKNSPATIMKVFNLSSLPELEEDAD